MLMQELGLRSAQPAAQAPAYNPWIGWTYYVYLFNKLYSIKE
jgi:hypothetical protein